LRLFHHRIALIGATGRLGHSAQQLVAQAPTAGHVNALMAKQAAKGAKAPAKKRLNATRRYDHSNIWFSFYFLR